MSRDAEYFMVATTHEHRGEPRGHIVGWIRPGIVYRHILGADESAQSSYVICDGDGNPLLISNIAAAYPVHPNMIRSLPAGGYREFSSARDGSGGKEVAKIVPTDFLSCARGEDLRERSQARRVHRLCDSVWRDRFTWGHDAKKVSMCEGRSTSGPGTQCS
jgi:hypothetical protein